jgi:hypothetical protein
MVVRVLVLLALIGVGYLMYKIGKEFDVILDNETVSIEGAKYAAVDYGTIIIDGEEKRGFDMWADDRVIKKVVGAKHKLTIKVLNENDDSVIKTIEREITLNFNPRAEMLSIAAIAGESSVIRIPNPLYNPEPVIIPDDKSEAPVTEDETAIPGAEF